MVNTVNSRHNVFRYSAYLIQRRENVGPFPLLYLQHVKLLAITYNVIAQIWYSVALFGVPTGLSLCYSEYLQRSCVEIFVKLVHFILGGLKTMTTSSFHLKLDFWFVKKVINPLNFQENVQLWRYVFIVLSLIFSKHISYNVYSLQRSKNVSPL